MNAFLKILDQVGQIKVKSITDSLFRYGIWLIGFGTISASKFMGVDKWVIIILFSLGGVFLLVGLFFYGYFANKNPDYLRSEIYQLRKQSLELLGDKENQGNLNLDKLPLITSPYDNEEGEDAKKQLK